MSKFPWEPRFLEHSAVVHASPFFGREFSCRTKLVKTGNSTLSISGQILYYMLSSTVKCRKEINKNSEIFI